MEINNEVISAGIHRIGGWAAPGDRVGGNICETIQEAGTGPRLKLHRMRATSIKKRKRSCTCA
jgi:hypothetical protein